MQESKAPVAGKEKPKPRQADTGGTHIHINTGKPDTDNDRRQHKTKAEQQPDPKHLVETTGDEEIRPPIYDKHQRFAGPNGSGKGNYATPLAATLFTRFDPKHNGEQPAEHYSYIDKQYLKHGRL